ncbi:helix-turn-helix domain-containing protein [Vibrio gangliei]|uniref:helix-turn-helix domain-containing protein n=1 Tax=Vibrio gangliei TaxID=2077090 RepID=UPI000D020C9A|nr:helix-turn-helix domain-containing protein [Vibrio gangliei]
MALQSQKDVVIDGAETLPLEDVLLHAFGGDRKTLLASSNVPTAAQINNMVAYDYKVALMDNGNFAAITGKQKVFKGSKSNIATGLNALGLEFPSGGKFVENLMTLLKVDSLNELAQKLAVDEVAIGLYEKLESVPARFVIYVHLHTGISIQKLISHK